MTFEKFKRLLKRNHEILYNYVLTDDVGTSKMHNLKVFYVLISEDQDCEYDRHPPTYNLIMFMEHIREHYDRIVFGLL